MEAERDCGAGGWEELCWVFTHYSHRLGGADGRYLTQLALMLVRRGHGHSGPGNVNILLPLLRPEAHAFPLLSQRAEGGCPAVITPSSHKQLLLLPLSWE